MALNKTQLDALPCECCGKPEHKGKLCLHSRCHPHTPTWSWYNKQTGCLEIKCAECGKLVVEIKVQVK